MITRYFFLKVNLKIKLLIVLFWNKIEKSIKKVPQIENDSNIIIKNKILKLKENYINLRSFSVECSITILMSGESQFFIFSRCNGDHYSNENLVCFISKEIESSRKYLNFAIISKEKNKNVVKILKKQEIPFQKRNTYLDISEISFTFIDNGDNICYFSFPDIDQNSNQVFIGDFYLPKFEKSNLMFAGSGNLISIKKLEIKQTPRNSYLLEKNCSENVHKSHCCLIF